MTSTAIWKVGRITDTQRKRNLDLERQVKAARRAVEQAAENVNVGLRLRNTSLVLITENEEALREAHELHARRGD